jgi:hypothetical protein
MGRLAGTTLFKAQGTEHFWDYYHGFKAAPLRFTTPRTGHAYNRPQMDAGASHADSADIMPPAPRAQ